MHVDVGTGEFAFYSVVATRVHICKRVRVERRCDFSMCDCEGEGRGWMVFVSLAFIMYFMGRILHRDDFAVIFNHHDGYFRFQTCMLTAYVSAKFRPAL